MPEGVGMTSEEETIARNADSAKRLTAAQGLTISSLVDIVCTKDVSAVDRTVAEKKLVKALVIEDPSEKILCAQERHTL